MKAEEKAEKSIKVSQEKRKKSPETHFTCLKVLSNIEAFETENN